jgi:hypothetical protein
MFRSPALFLLLGAAACAAEADPGTPGIVPVPGSGGAGPRSPVGTGGAPGTGAVASGGSQGGGATTGTVAYSDLPCDVGNIMKNSCSMCHGATPSFGAPMSLVRAADFAKSSRDGTGTVGKAVMARVNDSAHMMPPPPTPQLTPAEKSTIGNWIQGGAKPTTCATAGNPSPTGGASGSDPEIADPTDPDVTCYNITARDAKKAKFTVPNTPDIYHCFSYAPPWGSSKVHLVSWRPIIDNKQVIHHWILYNESTAVTDGADADCLGAHPAAQMTAGWAPGGLGSNLPPDVGQDVAGSGFTLEAHYNNTGTAPVQDASGVRVCVTKKLRQHEAGIHWLGTELILLPAGGEATGICQPTMTQPVTILSSTPHMHLAGRHLKTVITRANGKQETLLDKPFDFQTQVGYPTPATVMPGDVLTTTCSYGAAAFYGEGTKQEMCYNFVLAYPNGGLSSGLGFLRRNGCTGL